MTNNTLTENFFRGKEMKTRRDKKMKYIPDFLFSFTNQPHQQIFWLHISIKYNGNQICTSDVSQDVFKSRLPLVIFKMYD